MRSKPQEETFLVDEEGDYYPPATALAAFLEGYGGDSDLDGTLVEVSAFTPHMNWFEVIATSPIYVNGLRAHDTGEVILAYSDELRPINKHTQKYIKATTEVAVEIFDKEAYDIRDMLSLIDIHVTAESVAKWDGRQRGKIEAYAAACIAAANDHPVKIPPKPPELS